MKIGIFTVAPEYEYAAEEARDACPVSVISLEG